MSKVVSQEELAVFTKHLHCAMAQNAETLCYAQMLKLVFIEHYIMIDFGAILHFLFHSIIYVVGFVHNKSVCSIAVE